MLLVKSGSNSIVVDFYMKNTYTVSVLLFFYLKVNWSQLKVVHQHNLDGLLRVKFVAVKDYLWDILCDT